LLPSGVKLVSEISGYLVADFRMTSDTIVEHLDSTVVSRHGEQERAARGYNPNKRGRLLAVGAFWHRDPKQSQLLLAVSRWRRAWFEGLWANAGHPPVLPVQLEIG